MKDILLLNQMYATIIIKMRWIKHVQKMLFKIGYLQKNPKDPANMGF